MQTPGEEAERAGYVYIYIYTYTYIDVRVERIRCYSGADQHYRSSLLVYVGAVEGFAAYYRLPTSVGVASWRLSQEGPPTQNYAHGTTAYPP